MGEVSLWSFHPGDETLFLTILEESFRGLEYVPSGKQGLSNPYFHGEGSFIAEKHGSTGGCEVIFAPGGSLPKVRGRIEAEHLRLERR